MESLCAAANYSREVAQCLRRVLHSWRVALGCVSPTDEAQGTSFEQLESDALMEFVLQVRMLTQRQHKAGLAACTGRLTWATFLWWSFCAPLPDVVIRPGLPH
jgi:hypothetical protein